MALQLNDEPVEQLRSLQHCLANLKCNNESRMFYAVVDQHLTVLVPALTENINAMKDAAAFGQTLKQGQLKELRVRELWALSGSQLHEKGC